MKAWLRPLLDTAEDLVPRMPVQDRAADTWEPLVIVAELAGGTWPEDARAACAAMCAAEVDKDDESNLKTRLLQDIRRAFARCGDPDIMRTRDLLEELLKDQEAPWAEYGTTGLSPRHLGLLLKDFDTETEDRAYDTAGRLTSGCFPQPWVAGCAASRTTSYTYDKVGNRLTSTLGTTSTIYTYDAADQLTSTTTGTTTTAYDYDTEGNQTKKGADTYTYDLAGQISAATVAGTAYTYDHDASGNQVATLKDGAVAHRTQWDPNAPLPVLATEYDSAWNIKQSFRYDPLGQPTSVKTGTGALFYYHHDTQGSPVDVTNSAGTLYQRWAYDPFGTRVLGTTTGGAPASPPSYTGARYETTTGNLDLHARQYDTTTGRFTRPDPATRAQTTPYISPYAYADNVPALLTDPSGLTPDDPNDDRVDSLGEAAGIFGDAFVEGLKSPFVFLGDAYDAFTGQNGGAGAFVDKYLPVRPAYRLYRAESLLRQQGCDALADLYAEAAEELTQQIALVGVGGLTGWRRAAVEPDINRYPAEPGSPTRYGPGAAHSGDPSFGSNGYRWAAPRVRTDVLGPGEAWHPSHGTPVIGRLDDTLIGGAWSHNAKLTTGSWTLAKNDAWIQTIIDQRGTVYVTSPTAGNYWLTSRREPTVFAREIQQLLQSGYKWKGDYLVPPKG